MQLCGIQFKKPALQVQNKSILLANGAALSDLEKVFWQEKVLRKTNHADICHPV